jgi:hypothetical protein
LVYFCELLAGQGLHAAIFWNDELARVGGCDGGECRVCHHLKGRDVAEIRS